MTRTAHRASYGRRKPPSQSAVEAAAERARLRPRLVEMVADRMSYAEIGAVLGLSKSKVARICKREGIELPPPDGVQPGVPLPSVDDLVDGDPIPVVTARVRAALQPKVAQLMAEGHTYQGVSDALNGIISCTQVRQLCRTFGIRSAAPRGGYRRKGQPAKPRARAPRPRGVAHCCVCDTPLDGKPNGTAEEHQRLTSRVVAGVIVSGRCEGSGDQLVWRPREKAAA